jgi:uncharacterized membrane protein YkvA (DUF1232 family)
MDIGTMMKQIEAAVAEERRTHGVRNLVLQFAQRNGQQPTDSELEETVRFIIEYVESVPFLLMMMHGAAIKLGAQKSVEPLLEACDQYWKTGFDIIPDHLGLVGYTDDGYYVLSILHVLMEKLRKADGTRLIEFDLAPFNRTMRGLIGEPYATLLDTAVATAVAAPSLNAILQGLLQFSGGRLVDRHPIWGDASIDDIVKVQMGAVGAG